MSNSIVPEIMKSNSVQSKEYDREKRLNIHLSHNVDRSVKNYNYTNTTYNTTNNINRKGLFSFLLSVIFFPFYILQTIWTYFMSKYDVKGFIETEKIKVRKSKFVTKYLKTTEDMYNQEEIF